ncbi:hypothetical protein BHE74_00034472 [Ensete ventricosum]|nr:hypothetical protein BHE74_00034472 [Ensete ventricosum]
MHLFQELGIIAEDERIPGVGFDHLQVVRVRCIVPMVRIRGVDESAASIIFSITTTTSSSTSSTIAIPTTGTSIGNHAHRDCFRSRRAAFVQHRGGRRRKGLVFCPVDRSRHQPPPRGRRGAEGGAGAGGEARCDDVGHRAGPREQRNHQLPHPNSPWPHCHPAAADHLCRQHKDCSKGISRCSTPKATIVTSADTTISLFPFSRSEHRCLHDAANLYRNNLSLPSLSQRCSFPVAVVLFLSCEDNPTTASSSAITVAPAISHIYPPTVGPIQTLGAATQKPSPYLFLFHNHCSPATIVVATSTTTAPSFHYSAQPSCRSPSPQPRTAALSLLPPTTATPCSPAASFSAAIFLPCFSTPTVAHRSQLRTLPSPPLITNLRMKIIGDFPKKIPTFWIFLKQ